MCSIYIYTDPYLWSHIYFLEGKNKTCENAGKFYHKKTRENTGKFNLQKTRENTRENSIYKKTRENTGKFNFTNIAFL